MAFDRTSTSSTFKPCESCFCKTQICWGCVRHGCGADRPDSVHVFCIVKHNEQKSIIPESAKDSAMGSIEGSTTSRKYHGALFVWQKIDVGQRCNGLDRGLLLPYYIGTSNQCI